MHLARPLPARPLRIAEVLDASLATRAARFHAGAWPSGEVVSYDLFGRAMSRARGEAIEMDVDRRSFLRAAVATAVAAYVPFRASGVAAAQTGGGGLTMASFTPHVNTPFRFRLGGRSVTMPLTQVTDERSAAAKAQPGSGECFSLLFAGALPAFGQGTYTVDHAALGRLTLFVVPVGRRTSGQDYQVAFNHCRV